MHEYFNRVEKRRDFCYSLRGRDLICIRNPLKIHQKIFWSVLLGLCKVLTDIAVSMQQHSFFSYSGKGGAGQHKFSHTWDFMCARVNQHLYTGTFLTFLSKASQSSFANPGNVKTLIESKDIYNVYIATQKDLRLLRWFQCGCWFIQGLYMYLRLYGQPFWVLASCYIQPKCFSFNKSARTMCFLRFSTA